MSGVKDETNGVENENTNLCSSFNEKWTDDATPDAYEQ
jgi:hypothetical protein